MKRVLAVAVLALLLLCSCARVATLAPGGVAASNPIVQRVNAVRVAHGEHPLAVNALLTQKAQWWALQMAQGHCGHYANGAPSICHSDTVEPLYVGVPSNWQWVGENVGACSCLQPLVVENGFEHSPHHLENILHAASRYIGVGIAYWHQWVYVVEEFVA